MTARAQLEDSADYVIVGTGAGGATAARVLSGAGLSVIMLEEGPHLQPSERERGMLDAMSQSMRDMATLTTRSTTPMPLLQGRCVGGSTAINSGIIWRMPESVRRDWRERFGLGELVDERAQDEIFDTLESELEIAEIDLAMRGGNANLMHRASEALGLPGRSMRRNAKRCMGAARCLQGCPNGARQSMDVSYVPFALAHGAKLYSRTRARSILIEHGRAQGVLGDVVDERGRSLGQLRVHGRRGVIIAAGAVHTPILLHRSGLRRMVGERFQAHPGAAVVGHFKNAVGMGFGATQSYEVPLPEMSLKLESLSLPPELLAARLPGAGAEWQARLSNLGNYAQWVAVARMRALGQVRPSRWSGPIVRYEPSAQDLETVKQGMALLVRMMFAAGADEVFPGVARLPEVFTSPTQADLIVDPRVRRSDIHLVASHHFGTACASQDPTQGVVGPNLQSHEVARLYVMDASVFPTNLGVNPQHSIMAVVFRAAQWLANEGIVRRAA